MLVLIAYLAVLPLLQRLRIMEFTLDHEAPYFSNMRRRTSRKVGSTATSMLAYQLRARDSHLHAIRDLCCMGVALWVCMRLRHLID